MQLTLLIKSLFDHSLPAHENKLLHLTIHIEDFCQVIPRASINLISKP